MTTRDDSVMLALSELRRLEAERVEEERKAGEARAAAEARARSEAEAREAHARAVAEEEARIRVERDLRVRDLEAERRLAALRAELDAVRADRERIHAVVAQLGHEPSPPRRDTRGWLAFGAALAAATAILVAILAREPAIEERIVQVPIEPPRAIEVAADDAPVTEEPATSDAVAAAVATAAPEPGQTRPTRPRPPTQHRPPAGPTSGMHGTAGDDPALDFDHCGDDPTCGLDF